MIGTRLGHYVIESQLGVGGMGVVYRAFDTRLERRVAIKMFRDVATGAASRARLLREARSASALNHPHVCVIHEVAEFEDIPYLVMEYLEGQPLGALIPAGGLPVETVVEYGVQIAGALAHAHARGVIHRDLKSANIVVTNGRTKVLDFGLAVRQSDSKPDSDADTRSRDSLMAPGAVAGTIAWMAPESLRGAAADARSDIWALGVVLYEMACARLPFQGQTTYELTGRVLNSPPLPIPDHVPQALRSVVLKCLAKSPDQRYQNAGEVGAALEAVEAGSREPDATGAVESAATLRAMLVLPFVNLSADPESDYFSDGLTDEIITDLSGIRQLRVISRTTSMRLKGTERPLADLARELRIEHVLEGSVRRSGNLLRVTAKLIDAGADSTVWGEKYSGTLDDVFLIQETISRSIVGALRIRITEEEAQRLAERPIADVRAYEWYLRAKQQLLLFTEDSLSRALECLAQSAAIVGENVLLLAAQGQAYWQYVNAGISSDLSYLDKADACALRILQIDPASPHGHRVAGLVRIHRGDIQGALRELKKALERDPNDADSLMWGSLIAGMCGKLQHAEAWAARLVEIDPVTPFFQALPGCAVWMGGEYETARVLLAEHEAAIMENPILRLVYGQILVAAGRPDAGDRVLESASRDLPDNPFGQLAAVYRHALKGEWNEALARLRPELVSALEGDPQYCWFLAHCHALVNDVDGGIRWVEAAASRGFINYPLLARLDPFLENLRGDARYQALMRDVERRWKALAL